MHSRSGKSGGDGKANQDASRDRPGDVSASSASRGMRSRKVIKAGIESVAGAARLAIAAAEDMLAGDLTAQEATVLNTTVGRVLKASELYLKYARGGESRGNLLMLPEG